MFKCPNCEYEFATENELLAHFCTYKECKEKAIMELMKLGLDIFKILDYKGKVL